MVDSHTPSLRAAPLGRGDSERRRRNPLWRGVPDRAGCVRVHGQRVATWPALRNALMARQHAFARPPGLVADGRDMGTVVFPGAALKIFLVASPEERAQRRYNQLKGKDSGVSLAALSREIEARDRQDSTRPGSPLVRAEDAIVVDSTRLGIAEVIDAIWRLGAQRGLWPR